MQNYGVTSLIGAPSPGTYFSDIFYMNHDGNFVLNDTSHSVLNVTHPIQQIVVSSGAIVDGLNITYQLEGGNTSVMSHGSTVVPQSSVVSFSAHEVLAAVYGREGHITTYNRSMVNNIAFVIFDTKTETSRTVGPFGKSNQGKPFWQSDVLAIGGFAENTTHYGLAGLFFYKNPSNTTNQAIMPTSAQAGNSVTLD